MKRMSPNSRQRGFVITLELVLIITILVLGSLVGLVAIRDALVKHYVMKQNQEAIVVDAAGTVLGKAVDFDEHDAPRIFLMDQSKVSPSRTLIAIRDDRFTSREAIYYSGANCTGTPCIKTISDETTDSIGVDGQFGSGNVSYFNALQGMANYAVGAGENGLPGALFSESPQACPVPPSKIGSRWVSQKIVVGDPCETVNLEDKSTVPAFTGCLINTLEPCECPGSYSEQGDVLANYLPAIDTLLSSTASSVNALLLPSGQQIPAVEIGTLCCPEAMKLEGDNLVNATVYIVLQRLIDSLDLGSFPLIQQAVNELLAPFQGDINCSASIQLKAALAVPGPVSPDKNILEGFSPPFWVSLPGRGDAESWTSVPPAPGEGTVF
ncbi:type II secretion system protein [Marinobacter fonticola]|uniref:type II secretion system protein n=1 Tax=Marinobacter fonticola TaxID=2603215 RepID=UPI0011E6B71C|nr:hypothetical protein [Marinobacter fonticola]